MARWRRPRPYSQRDDPSEPFGRESKARGLAHENNGCAATVGSRMLDFDSGGAINVRGGQLRHKLRDPDGQTGNTPTLSLNDIADAWQRGWGREYHLAGANERTWSHIVQLLREGRMVHATGDSGLLDGACSEGQDVEHSIAIHPDTRIYRGKRQRLVLDPWCYRQGSNGIGRYRWLDEDDLRRYSAALGHQHAWTRRRAPLA